MNKLIQVTRSFLPEFSEYVKEIEELWDSHHITNMGIKHRQFQGALIDFLKIPYLTLFTNGHMALESAIEALELTGEVITSPFTFASTTHAIIRKGLVPVFCDIEPNNFTIDVKQIEGLITEKTSAIIPIHVYGHVCDIEAIEKIAKKYNLKVIYDAAHCFGITVNDKSIASFGDISVFSFHATKIFHTIEGGAATYSNMNLVDKFDKIKNFGISNPESVDYIGGNSKMNEFVAAMGLCNLRHFNDCVEKRKNIVKRYRENLTGIKGIVLPLIQECVKSNYAYFPVLFDDYKWTRDEVFQRLANKAINARKYFYPLISDYACYKDKYDSNKTPIAKHIANNILTLPIYEDLTMEDVDFICSNIIN